MSRQRYSFYKRVESLYFGWMQIPSHSATALSGSSGRVSGPGLPGLLGPAGPGSDLTLWVSEHRVYQKATE